jgi:glycosyltransferase involved in cell wall biosynthesis
MQKYPFSKVLLRAAYIFSQGLLSVMQFFLYFRSINKTKIYYAGARSGDIGGPLVKVTRLRKYYPQVKFGFNMVYSLSNAPYLPNMSFAVFRKLGIPVVHNQNGVFYKSWFSGDWLAENRRMAVAYHAADWVFYQSQFCQKSAEKFLGTRSGDGKVLYNAVDLEHFCPKVAQGARGNRIVFLVTGKIDSHLFYRIETAITALAQAYTAGLDCELIVSGWISAVALKRADALRNLLNIRDKVHFTGAYTQAEAPDIYRRANVLIMTKHLDPCPNTVIEAMACGLPIIYSESGGVPELVGGVAGLGLKVDDDWEEIQVPRVESVVEAMFNIAKEVHPLGEASRVRAENLFDIKNWIEEHSLVFKRLLQSR